VRPLMTIIATLLITVPGLGGTPAAAPAVTPIAEDPVTAQRRMCNEANEKFDDKISEYTKNCQGVGVPLKSCKEYASSCASEAESLAAEVDDDSPSFVGKLTGLFGIPMNPNTPSAPTSNCAFMTAAEYKKELSDFRKAQQDSQKEINSLAKDWNKTKSEINNEKNELFDSAARMEEEFTNQKYENQKGAIESKAQARQAVDKMRTEIDTLEIQIIGKNEELAQKKMELAATRESMTEAMLKVDCEVIVRKESADAQVGQKDKRKTSSLIGSLKAGSDKKNSYQAAWDRCMVKRRLARESAIRKAAGEISQLEKAIAAMDSQLARAKESLSEMERNIITLAEMEQQKQTEQGQAYLRKQGLMLQKLSDLDKRYKDEYQTFTLAQASQRQNLMELTQDFYSNNQKPPATARKTVADLIGTEGIATALASVKDNCGEGSITTEADRRAKSLGIEVP
jgi:DNA repair exonuclease SbcCD ATPase subunit